MMYIRRPDIQNTILELYSKCNIKSFPIDCLKILQDCNIIVVPYSEIKQKRPALYKMCKTFSGDAFKLGFTVYYNDLKQKNRIRFSLMHELGHILLCHDDNPTKEMEQDANIFSSNILAPRMAIHYAKCQNYNEVSKLFNISQQAADIAFKDYCQWRRYVGYYKMAKYDIDIYNHFRDSKLDKFVWSVKECYFCGKKIYNDCRHFCEIPREDPTQQTAKQYQYTPPSEDFLKAEDQWLYGWL